MTEEQDDLLKIQSFLKQYSFDDIARSYFVLNLWLPNISSQIKIEYLYMVLESIHDVLRKDQKINTYEDFKKFCEEVIKLTPSFEDLEDYFPETDWGNIKYYFGKKFYKIFYGGSLFNPYDYYYSFEIIHKPLLNEYIELLKRSPIQEMQFCLEVQNSILINLQQQINENLTNISLGEFKVPEETFWKSSQKFLDELNPINHYPSNILYHYTKELVQPIEFPKIELFFEQAQRGQNCKYFFLKKNDTYYPAMPRNYLTVIYDAWGYLLKENYTALIDKLSDKNFNLVTGIELFNFLKERIKEENIFHLAYPVTKDLKPHELFFTVIRSGDKFFLIYVTPPIFELEQLSKYITELQLKLRECKDLLSQLPVRLGLALENKIVEFRHPDKSKMLHPIFLVIAPSPITDIFGAIASPDDATIEVMGLDQLVGIIDELEKPEDLSSFFDYLNKETEANRTTPLNSYLDHFSTFKNSHGVLIPGALEPDKVFLDVSEGTDFRYKSLNEFWGRIPEETFVGHPRSWVIYHNNKTPTGFMLDSKVLFAYAYYRKIGNTSFFINAPVHLMNFEEGRICDHVMNSLFDVIGLYHDSIQKLTLMGDFNKIRIMFFPSSLVIKKDSLNHVRHLVTGKNLWSMDSRHLGLNEFGIRVVFNDKEIIKQLLEATDRTVQIKLLQDFLGELNKLEPQANLNEILADLENEKKEKARFMLFHLKKSASFPEGILPVLPDTKEYKLATKEIAKIALALNIKPGKYSTLEAKELLNNLISKIVENLDLKIKSFDFGNGLFKLLTLSNALIHESWRSEKVIKASLIHEVDYDRKVNTAVDKKKFMHWYPIYRYLIEKFIHIRPSGSFHMDTSKLQELLALANSLLNMYTSSDLINYELYPVGVEIDENYIVSDHDEKFDISKMEREYRQEQANIELGITGNKEDVPDFTVPVKDYINNLDDAFKKDFGFNFKNFVNFQLVLALWAEHAKLKESTYYHASAKDISSICSKVIEGYDITETQPILDFLTIQPDQMLTLKNDPNPTKDLPIWEHNKRLMRYDIRPVIKIDKEYYWAPHSMDRASNIWTGIISKHKLPSHFEAPNVIKVLEKGHLELENNLVKKIHEIVSRYTKRLQTNVYPHKYDKDINDIGDFDILAYLGNKNILLNIESKVIDPPYSPKDSGRVQRKIFGQNRYLQRVEERAVYLKIKGKEIISKLGWGILSSDPIIISIFVTNISFWWTKYPPVPTEVEFIEIRLLNDYIRNQLAVK